MLFEGRIGTVGPSSPDGVQGPPSSYKHPTGEGVFQRYGEWSGNDPTAAPPEGHDETPGQ